MWYMLAVALGQLALVVIAGTLMLYAASRMIVRYLNNQFSQEFEMIEGTEKDDKAVLVEQMRATAKEAQENGALIPTLNAMALVGSQKYAVKMGYLTPDTVKQIFVNTENAFPEPSVEAYVFQMNSLADAIEQGVNLTLDRDAERKSTASLFRRLGARALAGMNVLPDAGLLSDGAVKDGYLDEGRMQTIYAEHMAKGQPTPEVLHSFVNALADSIEKQETSALSAKQLLAQKLRNYATATLASDELSEDILDEYADVMATASVRGYVDGRKALAQNNRAPKTPKGFADLCESFAQQIESSTAQELVA